MNQPFKNEVEEYHMKQFTIQQGLRLVKSGNKFDAKDTDWKIVMCFSERFEPIWWGDTKLIESFTYFMDY